MSSPPAMGEAPAAAKPVRRRGGARVIGPRLRVLLTVVFALFALLVANSLYLLGVRAIGRIGGVTAENFFYLCMFGLHLVLGLLLVVPFVVFGILHMRSARNRKNRRAVKIGYLLFGVSVLLLVSGVLLVRFEGILDLKDQTLRGLLYWVHVVCPLLVLWLFWLHRLVGPRLRWRVGAVYLGAVAALVIALVLLHSLDPRAWRKVDTLAGEAFARPSLAATADGEPIPAHALMMDHYCKECHADIHEGWFHSVHHFSSFNNPAYLASIRETRRVLQERDGDVRASRWCAGCHDPVPLLTGAFDDPEFDMANHPSAHAGITCTVCHAITRVNSTVGNADFTIEEPVHYPFAYSSNPLLKKINLQLVKAKPAFHKQQFLKDFHKSAEFCASCHKVHLPKELNAYKEFLRGQNHYDSYLLSGVSGHGARSFYYPARAEASCNGCHMPLQVSDDFGAQLFDGAERPSVHSHLFPSANTAVAWWRGEADIIAAHQQYLQDIVRVDLFGIREGGVIDGELRAPLRPEVPELVPGRSYLLETVVRTLKLGHLLTQGTADSNQLWLEVEVTAGGEVLGRSGVMTGDGEVDPDSHFLNVFMLDRDGNRIARRNAQDIFVPLYNNQIPPGAAQVVHYALQLPADLDAPVTVQVQLKYRKFDKELTDFVAATSEAEGEDLRGLRPGEPYRNELPVTVMATDRLTFPVAGAAATPQNGPRAIPEWERWNDYGIGLLLKGKAELRQAAAAFREVERLGRYDGPLNLARAYHAEGRLDEATAALNRVREHSDPPAPHWTLAWLSGTVNREQGNLEEAERNFRSVLEDRSAEMVERGFDFREDYEVVNLLGATLFDLAKQQIGAARKARRVELLRAAADTFRRTLAIDAENVAAHYNLQLIHDQLGEPELAAEHGRLHQRYKPDDNARDRAIALARQRYPAANRAAEAVVIYPLKRP